MATSVTEIAYLSLKPNLSIDSGDAAEKLKRFLAVIQKQEGYQRAYYGLTMENPDLLMLLIDWDSYDSHVKFMKDPTYSAFVDDVAPIINGIHFHHATLTPFPPKVLVEAPCVEFATFYDVEPSFLDNVRIFGNAVEKSNPNAFFGWAFGATVDNTTKHANFVKAKEEGKEVEEGAKAKALLLFIGWGSKEDHLKFRDTECFKENIWLLREKVAGGVEMFHVKFTAV